MDFCCAIDARKYELIHIDLCFTEYFDENTQYLLYGPAVEKPLRQPRIDEPQPAEQSGRADQRCRAYDSTQWFPRSSTCPGAALESTGRAGGRVFQWSRRTALFRRSRWWCGGVGGSRASTASPMPWPMPPAGCSRPRETSIVQSSRAPRSSRCRRLLWSRAAPPTALPSASRNSPWPAPPIRASRNTSPWCEAWLARLGLDAAALECGAHPPLHAPSAQRLAAEGRSPERVHNNCSGKHAGMITVARHLGAPIAGYRRADHPVQRLIADILCAMTGLAELPAPEIDGCGVPTWPIPLGRLAAAMARFAHSDRLPATRADACARLRAAMLAHPHLVAGTDRPCTEIMTVAPHLLVKTGAEGVYAACLLERAARSGAQGGGRGGARGASRSARAARGLGRARQAGRSGPGRAHAAGAAQSCRRGGRADRAGSGLAGAAATLLSPAQARASSMPRWRSISVSPRLRCCWSARW